MKYYIKEKVGIYTSWWKLEEPVHENTLPEKLRKVRGTIVDGPRLTIWELPKEGENERLLVLAKDGGTDHTNGEWWLYTVEPSTSNPWWGASFALSSILAEYGASTIAVLHSQAEAGFEWYRRKL